MSDNPYEPPKEVGEPAETHTAISLGQILKETLSAFGCLGAAIAAIVAAIFLLSVVANILIKVVGVARE